jgi:protein-S-isoprenylcysteine O-methyltransferase Ste14
MSKSMIAKLVRHVHIVISTGPYRIVRHPMYAGAIIFIFAAPLLVNSVWGFVLAPFMAVVF